ncbi:MAG: DUF4384 domain-containing protein [Candidatus Binatia bacterium]
MKLCNRDFGMMLLLASLLFLLPVVSWGACEEEVWKQKGMPDVETIKRCLGGDDEMKTMGLSGVRLDRRIPLSIPFAYNQDRLLPDAEDPLRNLGIALKSLMESLPTAGFVIEGHTDVRGVEDYNLHLSTRRAQRVVQRLVEDFGIAREKLAIKGYGEIRPLSLGSSGADHARNRRVEVVRVKVEELALYASIEPVEGFAKDPTSLIVDVGVFYEDPESRPRKLEEGTVLRSGDGYRIYFEPHQPCYVYIFQIDSSGKFARLYPNPDSGTQDNFVQAGVAHWVPGKDKWFTLDNVQGKEALYVVATKERWKDIEAMFTRYARAGDLEESTYVMKTLGPVLDETGQPKVRPGKNVTVASTTGRAVELTTDQLRQEGVSFAYKFAFRHE